MARWALNYSLAALMLLGWSGGALADGPDALVRQMAAQPLRYGGSLRGAVDGRILIGLEAPDADGILRGEAMLLTPDRHLIDTGTVRGRLQAPTVPGGHDCTLDLVFAARVMTVTGMCSIRTLSGEIMSRGNRAGWLWRQIFWWHGADAGGRAWLTRGAFYD